MVSPAVSQTNVDHETVLAMNGRTVRTRASRACKSCGVKKIRCSVVNSGIPCSNCRIEQVECIVTASKRRKRFRTDADVSDHSPLLSLEPREGRTEPSISLTLDHFLANAPTSLDFELSNHVPRVLRPSPVTEPCIRG